MNFGKSYRKFRKNAKALSPVIATIILIAVTVAVSVVVAAWMGALTIGFMGNSEQASITNVVLSNTDTSGVGQAVVTVQNTGSATVDISSQTIDGNTASVTGATGGAYTTQNPWAAGQVAIPKGTSVVITMTVTENFVDSASYTVKLMTAKGNTITTSATYNGP
jgi:flagellin-like protein